MATSGRTIFLVEIRDDKGNAPKDGATLAEVVLSISDQLEKMKGVEDPVVDTDFDRGRVEFSLLVDALDELDAIAKGSIALRSAINRAVEKIPEWRTSCSVVFVSMQG